MPTVAPIGYSLCRVSIITGMLSIILTIPGLKRAYRRKKPTLDRRLIRKLFKTDWVVYAKPAFGGPEVVLRYFGRYTHCVAISNHRWFPSMASASPSAGKITPTAT